MSKIKAAIQKKLYSVFYSVINSIIVKFKVYKDLDAEYIRIVNWVIFMYKLPYHVKPRSIKFNDLARWKETDYFRKCLSLIMRGAKIEDLPDVSEKKVAENKK